jgi:hypothetical protein
MSSVGDQERNGSPTPSNGPEIEEWKPTLRISILWTVVATFMTIAGFLLFVALYSVIGNGLASDGVTVESNSQGDTVAFAFQLDGMLALILITVGVLLVHEAIHAAGFRFFGGRPTFGAMIVQKILPVLYCSAPGYQFTRSQFSVIILAPVAVISLVGVALMPVVDNWMLLVFPLAVNLGGAVGDLWMFGMLLRKPSGTLVEDLREGLRFHYLSSE